MIKTTAARDYVNARQVTAMVQWVMQWIRAVLAAFFIVSVNGMNDRPGFNRR
ncbi:MAG: hypothetical protein JSS06_06080 [Proteobacteria bacterium]|nr:hypothetical protein [Pseudomonadota bacterium]